MVFLCAVEGQLLRVDDPYNVQQVILRWLPRALELIAPPLMIVMKSKVTMRTRETSDTGAGHTNDQTLTCYVVSDVKMQGKGNCIVSPP